MRSFACAIDQKSCVVGMRNAILKNHLNWQVCMVHNDLLNPTSLPSLFLWSLVMVANTVPACSPPITEMRAFGHMYRKRGLNPTNRKQSNINTFAKHNSSIHRGNLTNFECIGHRWTSELIGKSKCDSSFTLVSTVSGWFSKRMQTYEKKWKRSEKS